MIMRPKAGALGIAGSSVALLALGVFTDGVYFFAFCAVTLIILAVDGLHCVGRIAVLQRNLRVQRSLSRSELLLGSRLTITYHFDFTGWKGCRLQCLQLTGPFLEADEPSKTFDLKPGASELTFTMTPHRRGTHAVRGLRMTTETLLFRSTVRACGDAGVVAYTLLGRGLARASDPATLPISILARRIQPGTGPDFAGVRDFSPGDSMKNIDWARSTRSGTLIVRDFEDVCPIPLFLLMDVDASMEADKPRTELDAAVKIATMLAVSAMQDNERVGLGCFSRSDITVWMPLAGGQEHTTQLRKTLSSLKGVTAAKAPRPAGASIGQASVALQVLGKGTEPAAACSVIEEAINQFMFNVREDGFIKAISRAARATSGPCNFIIITSLSMGIDSLANGVRIARHFGHHVSIILTPDVWYENGEEVNVREGSQIYQESRDAMKRLQSMGIQVIELRQAEAPANVLTLGKLRKIKRRMR